MGETATMGATVFLVFKESRENKARPVPKVLPVLMGLRVHRVPRALLALLVLLAQDMVPGWETINHMRTSPGACLGDKTVLFCYVRIGLVRVESINVS